MRPERDPVNQLALKLNTKQPIRKRPTEPIVRTADKIKVREWTYRWLMHRAWDVAKPTIVWVMLNPSDADGHRDDPTTWRVIEFSYRWGFGSALIGNIYPLVSPDPRLLRGWRNDWRRSKGSPEDDDPPNWPEFYRGAREVSKAVTPEMKFVAAWGNHAPVEDVDRFIQWAAPYVDDEEFGRIQIEVDWWCLGKTLSGAPIHPLARGKHRVADDAKLKIWKRAQRPRGGDDY
jgi:hypothetical protein